MSSYAIDDGERLLFDPLAAPDALLALAREREPVIVLTAPWHERDAQAVVERLGAAVFAPPPDTAHDLIEKFGITAEQAGDGSPDLEWLRRGGGDAHWYPTGDGPRRARASAVPLAAPLTRGLRPRRRSSRRANEGEHQSGRLVGPAPLAADERLPCLRFRERNARFIRIVLTGWAYGAIHRTSHERTQVLDGWLWHYNHRRRHSALGHQPPVTRTNLLGSYIWSHRGRTSVKDATMRGD